MNTFARTLLALVALSFVIPSSRVHAQDEAVWLDVNIGLAASGADDASFAFAGRLYGEPAAYAAVYPKPSRGGNFDFGAGYMFSPRVGLGVSFGGTAHEDPVGLGATIPHPFFFNASAVASGATDQALTRSEGGAHIQVMFVPLHGERARVRLFAGPTYFRYQADMVNDLSYRQSATPFSRSNLVTITGFEAVEIDGTGWGLHVGGDVSYFFTRVFGIGGFARFSRGTVSIDEPLSETPSDLTTGGVQLGGGARFRF